MSARADFEALDWPALQRGLTTQYAAMPTEQLASRAFSLRCLLVDAKDPASPAALAWYELRTLWGPVSPEGRDLIERLITVLPRRDRPDCFR